MEFSPRKHSFIIKRESVMVSSRRFASRRVSARAKATARYIDRALWTRKERIAAAMARSRRTTNRRARGPSRTRFFGRASWITARARMSKRKMQLQRIYHKKTGGIIPGKKFVRQVYQGTFNAYHTTSIPAGVTQLSGCVIKANDAYDPNDTLTGFFNHSTTFSNYYTNLYGRYRVVAAYARFTFRQSTTIHKYVTPAGAPGVSVLDQVDQPVLCVGVTGDDDSTMDLVDWTQTVTDPNSKHRLLQFNANGDASATIHMNYVRSFHKSSDNSSSASTGGWASTGSSPGSSLLYYWKPWIQSRFDDSESLIPAKVGVLVDVYVAMTVEYTTPRNDLEARAQGAEPMAQV